MVSRFTRQCIPVRSRATFFSEQISVNIRQHALEAGYFVVNATAWLDADQQAQIMKDTGCSIEPISSGCFTAIVSPEGETDGRAAAIG